MIKKARKTVRFPSPVLNNRKSDGTEQLTHNQLLATELVRNAISSRSELLKSLMGGQPKEVAVAVGHPASITVRDYKIAYERGLGRRIVNFEPNSSWQKAPKVFEDEEPDETEFEKAWATFCKDFRVWNYLQRTDVLSGIGRFGVLLYGLDDGKNLSEPVEGSNHELLYLRPFDEDFVRIQSFVTDKNDSRFGKPELYQIRFTDPDEQALETGTTVDPNSDQNSGVLLVVHWTRVLHVAEIMATSSEIFGSPRQEPVYNRQLDIDKVLGGSGEMYWQGAFPGYAMEVDPNSADEIDMDSVKEEVAEYMNSLKRWLALQGITVKSLAPQVSDPTPFVDAQMDMIAAIKGWPKRIFMGSERGELASSQDTEAWNGRMKHRQEFYIDPMIIRPFIERMQGLGILPEAEFTIEWEDLNEPSDTDKAETNKLVTETLATYVGGNVASLLPEEMFFKGIMGLQQEEVDAIMKEIKKRLGEMEANVPNPEETPPQDRNGQANPPTRQPVPTE